MELEQLFEKGHVVDPSLYVSNQPYISVSNEQRKKMKVTIYGKPNCPNCVKAKNLCATKPAIEVEYIDIVEQDIDAVKLGEICGTLVREVPQIFVDDKHVGGWSALMPHVTQFQG